MGRVSVLLTRAAICAPLTVSVTSSELVLLLARALGWVRCWAGQPGSRAFQVDRSHEVRRASQRNPGLDMRQSSEQSGA